MLEYFFVFAKETVFLPNVIQTVPMWVAHHE